MKKFLSLFFAVVLIAAVPIPSASAEGPSDVEELRRRLLEVMERWPDGSYFTMDGGPCSGHENSESFSCPNCRRVTAGEAGTEGNMQCFGFARMVFWNVFGLAYPHYSSYENWKPSGSGMKNVVGVWQRAPGSDIGADEVRQAFSYASVGDVVHTGLPHTMVFLQYEDEGILVYDANYDMYTCGVQVHLIRWRELAKWAQRYGLSVWRAADYPELSGYEVFPLPGRDVGRLTVVSGVDPELPVNTAMTDFGGLELSYVKGDLTYSLRCTGGVAFEIVSSSGVFTADANAGGEFSPRINVTAGSAPEPGRIKIGFLDSVAVIDRDISEAPEPEIIAFTYPAVLEYTAGEEVSFSGASITVRLSSGGTEIYCEDGITFTEHDYSLPGTYRVFMEVLGLQTPPFVVTVNEAPPPPPTETVAPTDAPPTSQPGVLSGVPFVPILIGLFLVAVGIAVLHIGGKKGKKSGQR